MTLVPCYARMFFSMPMSSGSDVLYSQATLWRDDLPEPRIRVIVQEIGIIEDAYDMLAEYGVDRSLFQPLEGLGGIRYRNLGAHDQRSYSRELC